MSVLLKSATGQQKPVFSRNRLFHVFKRLLCCWQVPSLHLRSPFLLFCQPRFPIPGVIYICSISFLSCACQKCPCGQGCVLMAGDPHTNYGCLLSRNCCCYKMAWL